LICVEASAYLIRHRKLTEAQADELWTFIKKRSGSYPRTIPKKPTFDEMLNEMNVMMKWSRKP
jgi:hypothetical protein